MPYPNKLGGRGLVALTSPGKTILEKIMMWVGVLRVDTRVAKKYYFHKIKINFFTFMHKMSDSLRPNSNNRCETIRNN